MFVNTYIVVEMSKIRKKIKEKVGLVVKCQAFYIIFT